MIVDDVAFSVWQVTDHAHVFLELKKTITISFPACNCIEFHEGVKVTFTHNMLVVSEKGWK